VSDGVAVFNNARHHFRRGDGDVQTYGLGQILLVKYGLPCPGADVTAKQISAVARAIMRFKIPLQPFGETVDASMGIIRAVSAKQQPERHDAAGQGTAMTIGLRHAAEKTRGHGRNTIGFEALCLGNCQESAFRSEQPLYEQRPAPFRYCRHLPSFNGAFYWFWPPSVRHTYPLASAVRLKLLFGKAREAPQLFPK
jgi:hypothetical protein